MSSVSYASPQAASPSIAPGRSVLGLFSVRGAWMALALAVAFAGLYWRWFATQHRTSAEHMEDWGHAYVIPLISGYVIWRRRGELARTRMEVFWPGLGPLVLGVLAYFVSVVGLRNHAAQGLSLILTLFGLLLLMLGPRAMRWLFLPVAFLVFAVTLPEIVMIRITFQLQLVASYGAWILLSLIGAVTGFTAELDGNTITVLTSRGQSIPLDVAQACSGMRMVIAFYALAGAVALLTARHWWQRIATMLLAGPVAILMNVVRVAVLGVASLFNPELARGDAHMFIGTILLVPALLLFLGAQWVLDRVIREGA